MIVIGLSLGFPFLLGSNVSRSLSISFKIKIHGILLGFLVQNQPSNSLRCPKNLHDIGYWSVRWPSVNATALSFLRGPEVPTALSHSGLADCHANRPDGARGRLLPAWAPGSALSSDENTELQLQLHLRTSPRATETVLFRGKVSALSKMRIFRKSS